jgi:CRISPR-associated endonuclease/helicase Cas3
VSKFKHPILAKPSGITLDTHSQNVISEGLLLLKNIPTTTNKYNKLTGKSLKKRVELACQFHDAGKELSKKWQSACQKDYEEFLNWQRLNNGRSFTEYATEEDAGKHIRKAAVRHEFYSLLKNKTLPSPIQVAIAAHHGKLGENFENRWISEGFKCFWKKFKIESYKERTLELTAKTHYEFSGIRGLLQLADHRASAKEEGSYVPELSNFNYKFPHSEKRGAQKLIEKHWRNDDLLLVRAPTGSGKTDASLLWAQKQIESKRADRLIIAMPTRFTSNALAINVAESLSDTGLYHSSAWFTKFQEQVDAGIINKRTAEKFHEFARLLQTPITVCTIDHLLIALTLTREDHHLILFNLANSCLVIDEADFYDDFTQANILVLLEILKYWNVPILLMSASLPESILPTYRGIGYKIDKIIEDTTDNHRDRFEIKTIKKYSEFSEIEDLLNLCIDKGTAIIYINTVDKAIKLYQWFEKRGIKPMLYHSRFTEPHKKDKEQELIDSLGKSAWENNCAQGITILTQIGEMSINISADLMISELCPIDRLTQRAGRLCRFDKSKIGELHLLIPQKNGSLYPAPYGEYNLKEKTWVPCKAIVKTKELLTKTKYSAGELVGLLNQVYSDESEFSNNAMTNSQMLKEHFKYNWLINPMQVVATDDSTTNHWKSRNIAPQDTVFVKKPDHSYFCNYLEFQSWKIKNSLELPLYLIEKGRKNHMIDVENIKIKDETETLYVIRKGFYNNIKGVTFNEESVFL